MTRYAITHVHRVGRHRRRILTFANHARNHFQTAEEAETALGIFRAGSPIVSPEEAASLAVLAIDCDEHGDARASVYPVPDVRRRRPRLTRRALVALSLFIAGVLALTSVLATAPQAAPLGLPVATDLELPVGPLVDVDLVSALTLPAILAERSHSTTRVAMPEGLWRRDAVPGWAVLSFEPWLGAYGSACRTIWSPVETEVR